MNTPILNILVCSSNSATMRKMARHLDGNGVNVQASNRLIDYLCFTQQQWDFLLIDLDGVNSFLRSLLPAVSRKFPNIIWIGVSTTGVTEADTVAQGYRLQLDEYFTKLPRTEDLIVRFPQIADKFLCDVEALPEVNNSSANSTQDQEYSRQGLIFDEPARTTTTPFGITLSYDESALAL